MDQYEALAKELIAAIDRDGRQPPHDQVSASLRGEMAVIRLLAKQDGQMTAGDISRVLHMTTSRIAAVLGSLQKKGMIDRYADPEDRRRVLVELTLMGKDFSKERERCLYMDMTRMLHALGEEDAAHLVRIVKRLTEIALPHPPEIPEDFKTKGGI